MKKSLRKLVLRHQTVRVLAPIDLGRAVGGAGSGARPCQAIVDSGDKACTSDPPALATTLCG